MMAQTYLLTTEPVTHTSQSHWRQCLLCQDYSLNTQQLHKFYTLKQQANILFEGTNERWDLIKSLHAEYFQQQNFGKSIKTSGKQWLRLGFQGQNPETDFRGGGVLSLQLILRFVKNKKELVKVMQNDQGNFFFAITAINISFFMKKYFHLADFLIPGKDQQQYCNRRGLKNFCRILTTNQSFFEDLHSLLLQYFYKQLWIKKMKQVGGREMLLNFNSLFDRLKKLVKQVFQDNNLLDEQDFSLRWREIALIND